MKIIKLFGERNTGTNYFQHILGLNLNAKIISNKDLISLKRIAHHPNIMGLISDIQKPYNLGWKHSVPSHFFISLRSKSNLKIVTISKNPYSFFLSLHKRPYHNLHLRDVTFSEFIRSKWTTVSRENHWKDFKNVISLWNTKNKAYLNLSSSVKQKAIQIRYEDLLLDPELEINKISNFFDIPLKNEGPFINCVKSTKGHGKDFDYYKNYYLNEQWKHQLKAIDVRYINSFLDEQTLEKLSYEKINPNQLS